MKWNRRQFVQSAALATAAVATGTRGWAAAKPAAAKVTYVDCHTHIYDPTRPQGVPWPPREEGRLYRPVLPAHLRKVSAKHRVTGTIIVEASEWLADNDWVLEQAAKDKFILGVVGRLALEDPEFEPQLRRLSRNPLFRGIRVRGGASPKAAEKTAERALGLLADFNLTLDFNCLPTQLPVAAQVARQNPRLRIVINHLANVTIDGKAPPAAWVDAMKAVAEHERVFLKVSGLVEGTRRDDFRAPRELDYYRPVLDAATEIFGVNRLIFGSNYPVSELFAPYATVIGLIEQYFGEKGPQTLQLVAAENSRRAYLWQERK
ncbi:amidohydrolase family protein [Fontisphaera persica]|uniref:amidohydrolase family protein n=1 Tax=Fontisphaera persica TaxID=2974023 RepID=UPI0024BF2EE7|nr:amidohydrolase family protein [Fontisphaera persica]WCJ58045.1 amidohydrolase family protein [Fontisphaera persica]